MKETTNDVIVLLESGGLHDEPSPCSTIPHKLLQWCQKLLAALDAYCWAATQNIIQLKNSTYGNSQISTSISYFLSNVSLTTTNEFYSTQPSIKEADRFKTLKATIIVRIVNFLTIGGLHIATLWHSNHLHDVIILSTFQPSQLGFNMKDLEILTRLPGEMEKLLKVINSNLEPGIKNKFLEQLHEYIEKHNVAPYLQPILNFQSCSFNLDEFFNGCTTIHKAGIEMTTVSNIFLCVKNSEKFFLSYSAIGYVIHL